MTYYLSIYRRIGDPRGNSLCLSAPHETFDNVFRKVSKYFEMTPSQEERDDVGGVLHAVWNNPLPEFERHFTNASVIRSNVPIVTASVKTKAHFFSQYKKKRSDLNMSQRLCRAISEYNQGDQDMEHSHIARVFKLNGWDLASALAALEKLSGATPCPWLTDNGFLKSFHWLPSQEAFGYKPLLGSRLHDTDTINQNTLQQALRGEPRDIFAVTGADVAQRFSGVFGTPYDCAEWCDRWSFFVRHFDLQRILH